MSFSFIICMTMILQAHGDHVALHQADIDALESYAAHVSIAPVEPSPFEEQKTSVRRIARIFIPETWQGGDDGLTHIDRIFADAPDPKPVVYILGTPKISVERLQKLEEQLPKGLFARRSPVVLGIAHSPYNNNHDGVLVSQVQRESSAALAGIIAGDLITSIDNTEVPDFDSLVESLADRKPGQSVKVKVMRNGEDRTIVVTLKGWYDEDRRQRTKP